MGQLRSLYDGGDSLWLVLDCCSVHRQEGMKQYPAELGIHLLFNRLRLTGEIHLFDRFAFAVMNVSGHRIY
jgi:hypothetical protein